MHSSSLPEPSPSQIHGRLLYKCCLSSCFGEVDLWNSQGPPAKAPKLFRSQPNSSSKKKLFQVYVSAEERVWVDRKDFPPEGFFFFLFLSTQTILCRGLSYCWLQIQILSIYCSWLLCVVRKLKFAAGPFILANHADIKSLKASEWPLRGPHSALLFCGHCSSCVFSLCLLGIKPLLLPAPASDCHGSFCDPRPTPTGSCSGAESCHQLELSSPRVTGVCPASWGGGDTYPHTRSWWLCEHRTPFTSQRSAVPLVPRKKDLNNLV